MGSRKPQAFGSLIRDRRRQLDLTQEEVARRIKTSTPYVGHLESGKRHPSERVLARLSEALGLEAREMFFLANPGARRLFGPPSHNGRSAWEEFRRDERLHRTHRVSAAEMEVLEKISSLGEASSPRDYIYILNSIRHALGA